MTDRLAAYQFDAAVVLFGTIIENAAQEQVRQGDEWQSKYTMAQLLAPGFSLGIADDDGNIESVDGIMYDEV